MLDITYPHQMKLRLLTLVVIKAGEAAQEITDTGNIFMNMVTFCSILYSHCKPCSPKWHIFLLFSFFNHSSSEIFIWPSDLLLRSLSIHCQSHFPIYLSLLAVSLVPLLEPLMLLVLHVPPLFTCCHIWKTS